MLEQGGSSFVKCCMIGLERSGANKRPDEGRFEATGKRLAELNGCKGGQTKGFGQLQA